MGYSSWGLKELDMTEQLNNKNSLQGLLSPLGADPCQAVEGSSAWFCSLTGQGA